VAGAAYSLVLPYDVATKAGGPSASVQAPACRRLAAVGRVDRVLFFLRLVVDCEVVSIGFGAVSSGELVFLLDVLSCESKEINRTVRYATESVAVTVTTSTSASTRTRNDTLRQRQ